ncbi:MAG: rRNA maturation RNase YbeY [Candidatus Liptonbacteria bacterium]|nr:rRNA maturation RNase YbeY [Candidatus Liptonbacteria bacterium]
MSGRKEKTLIKKLECLASKMAKVAPFAGRWRRKADIIDIFLLSDAEMKRLKKRFLPREKGLANVLSFGEPKGWPRVKGEREKLGEIYLNLDLTESKMDKMAPLLSHGVLHLLGYDHKKKNDRIEMEKLERKIAKILNKKF